MRMCVSQRMNGKDSARVKDGDWPRLWINLNAAIKDSAESHACFTEQHLQIKCARTTDHSIDGSVSLSKTKPFSK